VKPVSFSEAFFLLSIAMCFFIPFHSLLFTCNFFFSQLRRLFCGIRKIHACIGMDGIDSFRDGSGEGGRGGRGVAIAYEVSRFPFFFFLVPRVSKRSLFYFFYSYSV